MSDTTNTTTDPMLALLLERLAILDAETAERRGRRLELLDLIEIATDGRSRVNRQRRTRPTDVDTAKPKTEEVRRVMAQADSLAGLAGGRAVPDVKKIAAFTPTPAQQIAADWDNEVRGT